MNRYETIDGSTIYRVRVFGEYVNLDTEDGNINLRLWYDRIAGGMCTVALQDIDEVVNAGEEWVDLRRNG